MPKEDKERRKLKATKNPAWVAMGTAMSSYGQPLLEPNEQKDPHDPKDPENPQNPEDARIIYGLYRVAGVIGLFLTVVVSYIAIGLIIKIRIGTTVEHTAHRRYLAYAALPTLLFFSLMYITCNLGRHCDQERYASYCRHQLPTLRKDCDVRENLAVKACMSTETVVFVNPASNTYASTCTVDDKEGLGASCEDMCYTMTEETHFPRNGYGPNTSYGTNDNV